jgi:hypothetical protein
LAPFLSFFLCEKAGGSTPSNIKRSEKEKQTCRLHGILLKRSFNGSYWTVGYLLVSAIGQTLSGTGFNIIQ